MKKNWYILYTRPGSEKKIAASLAKKEINYYVPLCNRTVNMFSTRFVSAPLFPGYIFVRIPIEQLMAVQEAVGALSVVYWKKQPVAVPYMDIKRIKEFIAFHEQIEVIPTKVFSKSEPVAEPPLMVDEINVAAKKKGSKLVIPSIGFMLVSEEKNPYENTKIILIPNLEKALN